MCLAREPREVNFAPHRLEAIGSERRLTVAKFRIYSPLKVIALRRRVRAKSFQETRTQERRATLLLA